MTLSRGVWGLEPLSGQCALPRRAVRYPTGRRYPHDRGCPYHRPRKGRSLHRRDAFQRYEGSLGTPDTQKVNSDVITKSDLNAHKRILVRTNTHLAGYDPGGDIQASRGVKYVKVISKLFPRAQRRAPRRSALRQYWASFRSSQMAVTR